MHRLPFLLLTALLLSGCSGGPGNDGRATIPDPTEGPASLPFAGPGPIVMSDCQHLLGFLPMDWSAAEALLPDGFSPITWTLEEDRSLAILEVLLIDCASVQVEGTDIGPAASFWMQPDVVADLPMLEQNNFHAYSVHSKPELAAFWQRLGPAHEGAISFVADVPERTAVATAKGPSLDVVLVHQDPNAIAGIVSNTWRVFADNGTAILPLDMHMTGVRGTFLGVLHAEFAQTPFPIHETGPAGSTSGFGNGHGPMQQVRFTGST